MATIDSFIKFDGVEGESAQEGHEKEIEVLSWNWSVHNASQTSGGGSGKGKGEPGAFSFVHGYDKASPVLAQKCAKGEHFPNVTFTARKSGGDQKEYLKIKMTEVYIVSVSKSGHQGGEVQESVSMSFGNIEIGYKPQEAKGSLAGEVKMAWNIKSGKVS